jgi:regulator of protease activity HflC (stomatin/prohibitin superfamily)
LSALLLSLAYKAIQQVPQGYEYTVESFGRYTKTLQPGLHFLMPFVERVGAKAQHDGTSA